MHFRNEAKPGMEKKSMNLVVYCEHGTPRRVFLTAFGVRDRLLPPFISMSCAPVAQLDRALASGARGHRFESCRAYQYTCVTRSVFHNK